MPTLKARDRDPRYWVNKIKSEQKKDTNYHEGAMLSGRQFDKTITKRRKFTKHKWYKTIIEANDS